MAVGGGAGLPGGGLRLVGLLGQPGGLPLLALRRALTSGQLLLADPLGLTRRRSLRLLALDLRRIGLDRGALLVALGVGLGLGDGTSFRFGFGGGTGATSRRRRTRSRAAPARW